MLSKSVIFFGSACLDHFLFLSEFPAIDSKCRTSKHGVQKVGGNAVNAALQFSLILNEAEEMVKENNQNIRVMLVTSVGANEKPLFEAVAAQSNVELVIVERNLHLPTPITYILVTSSSRTCIHDRVEEWREIDSFGCILDAFVPAAKDCYILAIDNRVAVATELYNHVNPRFFALDIEKERNKDLDEKCFKLVSLLQCSKAYIDSKVMQTSSGDDYKTLLLSFVEMHKGLLKPSTVVVVTLGAAGAFAVCVGVGDVVHCAAHALRDAPIHLNTTGAGDAHFSSLIYALYFLQLDLAPALQFAATRAALSISRQSLENV